MQQRVPTNSEQAPAPLSRSQRTHARLSWPERLARNGRERLLAYLATHLPDLSASSLAWLMVTLRLANRPATMPLLVQAAALLNQRQQPTGSWQSEDGPERDAHATLEALRAFMLLSA